MLSYWFPAPLSLWWPLGLAIGFAIIAVVAVIATLARRREEEDAQLIAAFYGVGLGLVAVSELLVFLDLAFGWSLATVFAMTSRQSALVAVIAAATALVAVIIALGMQVQEESTYRSRHQYAP